MNGFISFGKPSLLKNLSPPTSMVRTTTESGLTRSATVRYISNCSSSVGGTSLLRNRNSVRNSPTPRAPWLRMQSASSGSSMFARSETM